jgi:hypothetical protein
MSFNLAGSVCACACGLVCVCVGGGVIVYVNPNALKSVRQSHNICVTLRLLVISCVK